MLSVLYQDEWLLAVEKPGGLPTLPAPRGKTDTLAARLVEKFPEQAKIKDCGIVHRLDNDTSGIVITARTQAVYEHLRAIWNTDAVQKTYLALVVGKLRGSGTVNTPIAHHPRKKQKMIVHPEGRPAITRWRSIPSPFPLPLPVLSAVEGWEGVPPAGVWGRGSNVSLLEISITTGIRHQIRVHLASIGYPLVGDKLYQTASTKSSDQTKHHQLHLSQISLPHPATKKNLVIQVDS